MQYADGFEPLDGGGYVDGFEPVSDPETIEQRGPDVFVHRQDVAPAAQDVATPPQVDESRGAGFVTRMSASLKPNDEAKVNYLKAKFGEGNVFVRAVGGEPTIYMRENEKTPFHPFDPKGLDVGDVADFWGDTIPVAASVAGGAIGSAAGPAGSLAGMASGAWLGNLAKQGLSAALPGEENVSLIERVGAANKEAALSVIGAGAGAVASKVGGAALGAASNKLTDLGRARLFKAAVGQTKKAFTQLNGKGLLEKAGQYLDEMGIGWGDSTESIAKKLATRRDAVGTSLDEMVTSLDAAAGGKVTVSPDAVADQIEKKVAVPLKRLAAARGDYGQIAEEIKAIREIGKPLTFAEAAEQRAAMQNQINYDVKNGRDVAAKAKREIAKIWNEEIDKQAEGLLRNSGKAGDAYRELRHEFSLAQELLKHVENRAQGNAANRVLSPSDYGMGGIAGVMTSNPFLGIAAGVANHLGRVYGNVAAGRSAIGMARMASAGRKGAERVLPTVLQGARVIPLSSGSGQSVNGPMIRIADNTLPDTE